MTYLLKAVIHNSLHVQNKSGTWIPVSPVSRTLVVNIGRHLEIISGGICTAKTHRVNTSRDAYIGPNGEELGSRLSLPFFQHVNLKLMPEDMHLNIPSHLTALVKGENIILDSETFFSGFFEGAVGDSVLVSIFRMLLRDGTPICCPWH